MRVRIEPRAPQARIGELPRSGLERTPANSTASPHSDDIDAIPGAHSKRSDTNRIAILKPRHLPETTEYGQIEYGGLPVRSRRAADAYRG